jgi:hypothetical protein
MFGDRMLAIRSTGSLGTARRHRLLFRFSIAIDG